MSPMNRLTKPLAALLAAFILAGPAAVPALAQDQVIVHEIVVTAYPGRILTREREYWLAPGAAIHWQGGHPAELEAVRPDMRVTLELDPGTLDDSRPLVRAVILPLQ